MSVAYYIVLDKETAEFDTFVDGKSLAHEDGLQKICEKLGIKAVDDFLAMSAEDLADMVDEDIELPDDMAEEWFTPDEGLAWVAALTVHIKAHPTAVSDPQGCLDDLADYEKVLEQAKAIGANWHLSMDL